MTVSFNAGQVLTANQLNLLAPMYAVKASAQTVTNSTTAVSDNDIVFTLAPNQTYHVALFLEASASAAAHGIQVGYSVTGTLTVVSRQGLGPARAQTNTALTSMHSFGFNSVSLADYGLDGSNVSTIQENLIIGGGLSGGVLTLQWTQFAAGAATSTTLAAGTFAVCRVVA